MDINIVSLWIVTLAYPLVSISALAFSIALFTKWYYMRRKQVWMVACSFACLFLAIGIGLSSLSVSAFPLLPRATTIPWARLVISAIAIPLTYAAYAVARDVLEYLARLHVDSNNRGGGNSRGIYRNPGAVGRQNG